MSRPLSRPLISCSQATSMDTLSSVDGSSSQANESMVCLCLLFSTGKIGNTEKFWPETLRISSTVHLFTSLTKT